MALVAIIGFTVVSTAPAWAQTVIGKKNSDSVSVDMSVLDQLGRTPTVPQLLRPSVRSLLMPNALRPAVPRFSTLLRPRHSAPAASAGAIELKPLSRIKKRNTPTAPRVSKQTQPKPQVSAHTSLKVPPPPAPKIALLPKLPVAPPAAISPTKPAAKADPPPAQPVALTSRLASTDALKPGRQFRLGFDKESALISTGVDNQLDGVATSMKQNKNLRLQLLAYAGGGSQTPSQARRLSLSRALAVRSKLIEKGIRSTHIDVRALGNKSKGGPPDRVDIIITSR